MCNIYSGIQTHTDTNTLTNTYVVSIYFLRFASLSREREIEAQGLGKLTASVSESGVKTAEGLCAFCSSKAFSFPSPVYFKRRAKIQQSYEGISCQSTEQPSSKLTSRHIQLQRRSLLFWDVLLSQAVNPTATRIFQLFRSSLSSAQVFKIMEGKSCYDLQRPGSTFIHSCHTSMNTRYSTVQEFYALNMLATMSFI